VIRCGKREPSLSLFKRSRAFPFLHEYPQQDDSADKVEAKKMFIRFGLGGLAEFHQECTEDQITLLQQLPYSQVAIDHTHKISIKTTLIKIWKFVTK